MTDECTPSSASYHVCAVFNRGHHTEVKEEIDHESD